MSQTYTPFATLTDSELDLHTCNDPHATDKELEYMQRLEMAHKQILMLEEELVTVHKELTQQRNALIEGYPV